jgi:Na+:H+ antiporter
MAVPQRLSVTVEGESLFNDGTAAVMYGILVAGVASGRLGIWTGIQEFFLEVLGGIALGGALGYAISKVMERVQTLQVEITLSTVLAYSSYLVAQDLHVSGVIATVAAGVTLGNVGARTAMSPRTRIALWSFWEYFSFVVNSLLFLLIGLQVHVGEIVHSWRPMLLAVGTVVLGRILSVYGLVPISNRFSFRIPLQWQHILVAGGIRGALALALALSLDTNFPYRQQILAMTFGVVAVTIVFQGLSIKPLLRALGMRAVREDAYEIARVQQIAISSARSELDDLLRNHVISIPAYNVLRDDLDQQLEKAKAQVAEIYGKDATRINPEIRMARMRLIAAERSSMEEAVHNGLISQESANKMVEAADEELEKLTQEEESEETEGAAEERPEAEEKEEQTKA